MAMAYSAQLLCKDWFPGAGRTALASVQPFPLLSLCSLTHAAPTAKDIASQQNFFLKTWMQGLQSRK